MTIDEIVQRIYEERYQEPKDPETAAYMRDGMIREVVMRTLELATNDTHEAPTSLALYALRKSDPQAYAYLNSSLAVDLVRARRDRNDAHAAVKSWMRNAEERGELVSAGQEPGMDCLRSAEAAWHTVVAKLDIALDEEI
jgi:hypothetical protein